MSAPPPPRPPAPAATPCSAFGIQSNESVSDDKQATFDDKQGLNAASAPSAQHGNSADSLSATPTPMEGGFHQLATPEVSRRSSRSSSQSSLLSALSDKDGDYSPEEEDEGDEDEGQHTSRAWHSTFPNVATSAPASGSIITYGGPGNAWEEHEDRLLAKLVQCHGKKWQTILQEFNRKSSTQRSYKALENRWYKTRRGQAVSASSTFSRTTTSSAVTKVGPRCQPWTDGEVDVLRQSLTRHGSTEGSSRELIFKDFLDAFPTSSRSYAAVKHKFLHILRAEQDQQDEGASSEEDESESSLSPRQSKTTTGSTRHRSYQQNQLPPKRVRGTGSKHADANSFARWQAEDSSADVAPPRRSQHSDLTSASDSAPDVDVGIIYADGGLIIEDCPKLYEVRIFSPTYVKITRQRSNVQSASSVVQQPAFHFQVLHDNSIDAVAIPPGTTANMAAVRADGRGATVEAGGMVLERRWSGPDGYFVIFRSAL